MDTLVSEVANALAVRAADAAFDAGRGAWATLVRLVRARFSREPDAARALAEAQAAPQDPSVVRTLAEALARVVSSDADFAARLREQWLRVTVSQQVEDEAVANSSSGTVAGNQVQARDIDVYGGLHLHAGTAPPRSVPRQLPPTTSHFTGRSADLAKLDALLNTDGSSSTSPVLITAVSGAAGIGKTALAVYWAHRVRHRFPDGDLFVNLRGYDRTPPLDPRPVLEGFLRALDVPAERMPTDLEAQSALFRTLLSSRRMLVVLDNAVNAQQVRPLLPGSPGCLVLITSRSQLAGLVIHDGAHRMTVDMLPPHEAVALLGAILGRDRVEAEPLAAAELAAACVHLPLALRIAAELADTRPRTTLGELAAELSVEHSRLDALTTTDDDESTAVRAVLSWSYNALTKPAARAFRVLGLHPGPDFSDVAAAALLGTSLTAARRFLGVLTEAHLLARHAQRYRFHDLLREYAAELAHATETQGERNEVLRRLLAWYLGSAQVAGRLLYQDHAVQAGPGRAGDQYALPLASRDQALAWCRAEHANLLAATRLAASVGDDVTAWRLPAAMRAYFQLQLPFADWIAATEIGLAAARRLGDRLAQAAMHSSLGGSYNYQGRPQMCLDHHLEALEIHRSLSPVTRGPESEISTSMILVNVGAASVALGRREEGMAFLKEARALAQRTGERDVEGHALDNLAASLIELKLFDKAAAYLREALEAFAEVGRPYGQALSHSRLADLYVRQEQYGLAVEHAERASEIGHQIGDRLTEAYGLAALAYALRKSKRHEAATEHWQHAMTLVEELGDRVVDPELVEYLRDAAPEVQPDQP